MERRPVIVGAAALVLLAAVVVVVLNWDSSPDPGAGDEVRVPRLADPTTVAEARTTLEGLGLVVELTSVMCPTHALEAEFVLAVTPRPGTVVAKGTDIVISRCLWP